MSHQGLVTGCLEHALGTLRSFQPGDPHRVDVAVDDHRTRRRGQQLAQRLPCRGSGLLVEGSDVNGALRGRHVGVERHHQDTLRDGRIDAGCVAIAEGREANCLGAPRHLLLDLLILELHRLLRIARLFKTPDHVPRDPELAPWLGSQPW